MPEVSTVATTAEYLNKKCKNKIIKNIILVKPFKNFKLFKQNTFKVVNVNSKGKISWFELKNNKHQTIYIIYHFKMTGMWELKENKHTNHILMFNNFNLYYNDSRGFSSYEFSTSLEKLNKIAPDFLKTNFTNTEFYNSFNNYLLKYKPRKKIKIIKLLLDQSAIGSGIGNYLVAEILYNAKISPHRILSSLTKSDIKQISHSIKLITKSSYYNTSTLGHYNLGKIKHKNYHPDVKHIIKNVFVVYQQKYDHFKNPVKRDKILSGKTTYWVPNIQK